MISVKDKVVIVTGAASGLGEADARMLAAEAATVIMTDINTDAGERIAKEIGATFFEQDVSSESRWADLMHWVEKDFGRLDGLVNNAGIVVAGAFSETSEADIEKIVNINLWSVLYGSQLAYAQMIKQGSGNIVNVSSSGGLMPVPNQTMYSAIKHAVVGFSHSLREEAALHGVKVNTVMPGMVQSDLWDSAINVKDYNMRKNMESTGLKPISAEDAAAAILQGIEDNDRSIIFPFINRTIVRLYRWFPKLITRFAVAPLAKPSE